MAQGASVMEAARRLVPKLTKTMHKGQAGRIAIVGGSFEYTGAPYYASMSSLKVGADLAFVLCEESAAVPIKSYTPEVIVLPTMSEANIDRAVDLLPRVHVLVIGPGLGRDETTLKLTTKLIREAMGKDVPLVLDGDALFLLTQQPDLVKGYARALLTPNVVEFSRLERALFEDAEDVPVPDLSKVAKSVDNEFGAWMEINDADEASPLRRAVRLARAMGNVTVMQKGEVDIITDGRRAAVSTAQGSNRRCGGQGDVLAGSSGVFLHWALNGAGDGQAEAPGPEGTIPAAFAASVLTRTANRLAFQDHHRSTTTPDIIEHLGSAFHTLFESDGGNSSL
ncbi:ATP-dependent S-NADPH-hydrate dehydratase [Hondaea fermentalgiana]|uniref:ATP-dependent (S)-NAD(P)H-hydrate dehydratase n=1 Tax=Hondaea fermentalgiana TaxID=2315210 RepID=A0A2R5GLD2_9STRA|nr:ATP-dependent S-NADPH-hydrate dehydratase [Hondaea fermentalgiana]|eukprot:GBG30548.1 ATP-dependent S-NADPH-hydrate dehydratase [Hondaea fermentalgiana]